MAGGDAGRHGVQRHLAAVVLRWPATPGKHTVRVRATDANGQTQTSTPAPPAPDGATGWHAIRVTIE